MARSIAVCSLLFFFPDPERNKNEKRFIVVKRTRLRAEWGVYTGYLRLPRLKKKRLVCGVCPPYFSFAISLGSPLDPWRLQPDRIEKPEMDVAPKARGEPDKTLLSLYCLVLLLRQPQFGAVCCLCQCCHPISSSQPPFFFGLRLLPAAALMGIGKPRNLLPEPFFYWFPYLVQAADCTWLTALLLTIEAEKRLGFGMDLAAMVVAPLWREQTDGGNPLPFCARAQTLFYFLFFELYSRLWNA